LTRPAPPIQPDPPRDDRAAHTTVAGVLLLVLAAVLVARSWPYLRNEHRRFEPWRIAVMYAAEAVSVLWLLNSCVRRWLLGPAATHSSPGRRAVLFPIVTVIAAVVIEGVETYKAYALEDVAYARGQVVEGVAHAGTRQVRPSDVWYAIQVRFTDASGRQRHARIRLWHPKGAFPLEGLHKTKLDMGKEFTYPFAVTIRYDPQWPARCWFEGQSTMNNRSRLFAEWLLISTFLQSLVIFLATFWLLDELRKPASSTVHASKLEFYKIIPLTMQVLVLMFIALSRHDY
jgi:hypothetical protein